MFFMCLYVADIIPLGHNFVKSLTFGTNDPDSEKAHFTYR